METNKKHPKSHSSKFSKMFKNFDMFGKDV